MRSLPLPPFGDDGGEEGLTGPFRNPSAPAPDSSVRESWDRRSCVLRHPEAVEEAGAAGAVEAAEGAEAEAGAAGVVAPARFPAALPG